MKWDKEAKRLKTALRQGVALGLALAGLWGVGLTLEPGAIPAALSSWSSQPGLALSLLADQVGVPAQLGQAQALTGWNRLLLAASAPLAAGEAAVLAHRAQPLTPQPEHTAPVDDPDHNDPELMEPPVSSAGTIDMTAAPKQGDGAIFCQGITLYNKSGLALDPDSLSPTLPELSQEGPQILILHTHGSEAYTQSEGYTYEPSDPYRTTDCTKNVVMVGEEMATAFRAHGLRVIHDTNLYDYPSYSGAYDRSKAAVEDWLEEYPSISIVLDVHRDALTAEDGTPYRLVTTEVGKQCAQIMTVVGTSAAGSSHVNWQSNLSFALFLQQKLETGFDALARPIVVRSSSFNQQLRSPGYLLVEVGGHGNTLEDALQGARFWADTVARALSAEAS